MQLADRLIQKAHGAHGSLAALRWKAGRGDLRSATWPEAAIKSSLTSSVARCNICGAVDAGLPIVGLKPLQAELCFGVELVVGKEAVDEL